MQFLNLIKAKFNKKPTIYSILLIIFCAFFIHVDRWILGKFSVLQLHDTLEFIWPCQLEIFKRLIHFKLPLWFPDLMGGLPFMWMDINWLSSHMWLAGLLPANYSFGLVTTAQYIVAATGMYFYLDYFLGLKSSTKLIGSLIWGGAVFNLTYWEISDQASIPVILYVVDRILNFKDRKSHLGLLLVFILTACNLTFAKAAPFVAIFHFFFIIGISQNIKDFFKKIIPYGFFWGLVVSVNLPMIVALFHSIQTGSRAALVIAPHHETNFIYLFLGVKSFLMVPIDILSARAKMITIFFFCFSLLNFKNWSILQKKLLAIAILFLIYISFIDQANWYVAMRTKYHLAPEFHLRAIGINLPFIFCVLSLAEFEKSLFKFNQNRKKFILLGIIVIAITILIKFFKHPFPVNYPTNQIEGSLHLLTGLYSLAGLYWLSKKIQDTDFKNYAIKLFLTINIVIFSIVFATIDRITQTNPPSLGHIFHSPDFEKYKPEHKSDFRIAFVNFHPTIGIYNGFQVAGGYVSQYLKRYALFWKNLRPDPGFDRYNYRAYLYQHEVSRDTTPPAVIKKLSFNPELLALHNVKYLFSLNEIQDPSRFGFTVVKQGIAPTRPGGGPITSHINRLIQSLKRNFLPIDYFVYKVENFVPRIFTPRSFKIVPASEFDNIMKNTSRSDFMETAIFSREDITSLQELSLTQLKSDNVISNATDTAQLINYNDNEILIETNFSSVRLLVLSENFSEEWNATFNGEKIEIMPAYGFVRSFIVPKGKGQLYIHYSPQRVINTFYTSAFILILFFVCGTIFIIFYPAKGVTKKESMLQRSSSC